MVPILGERCDMLWCVMWRGIVPYGMVWYGPMVLWFYGYTASLGHDFMTLRAFPGFHKPMALWLCGSMVPRPRSAPVLASARPGALA